MESNKDNASDRRIDSADALGGGLDDPGSSQARLFNPNLIDDWNVDSCIDASRSTRETLPMSLRPVMNMPQVAPASILQQMPPESRMMSSTPVVPSVVPRPEICAPVGAPRADTPHETDGTADVGVAAANAGSTSGNQLAAIEDTCDYVRNIVRNFNVNINTMPTAARNVVEKLNCELQSMFSNTIAKPDQDSSQSDSDAESDASESLSRNRCRRVTFSKPPATNTIKNEFTRSSPIELLSLPGLGATAPKPPTVHDYPGIRSSHGAGNVRGSAPTQRSASLPPQLQYPWQLRETMEPRGADVLSVTDLVHVLQRLDSRTVPKPDVYDLSSGQPISEFIITFEEYCRGTFRGSSSQWVGELGRMITGDLKVALDAMKAPGDTYESLKEKLVKWVNSRQELLRNEMRTKFKTAEIKGQESYSLYAARLENLFRSAYPRRLTENNKTLRTKYFDSVREGFRNQLQTTQAITKSLSGVDMSWSQVVAYASQYEVDNRHHPANANVNEVWFTQSSPNIQNQNLNPTSSRDVPVGPAGYERTLSGPRQPMERFRSPPGIGRGRSAPSRSMSRDRRDITCVYCEKPGHDRADCWRRLNLCLVCGSSDHRIATCPHRRQENWQPENPPQKNVGCIPKPGNDYRPQNSKLNW